MRKEILASLVDYMRNVGRLGFCLYFVTLLSGFFSVIGLFGKEIGIPTYVWFLLFMAGALFTPIVAYHKKRMEIVELRSDINNFLEQLPSIEVTTKVYEREAFLIIKNIGAPAEFKAQGKTDKVTLPLYMVWQITLLGGSEVTKNIASNEEVELKIASIHYEGEGRQKPLIVLNMREGNQYNPPILEEQVQIEISIISNPRLRSPFVKKYMVKRSDDNLSFEPIGEPKS